MADQELRELERLVQASGDPAARLRLHRALAQAGRAVEAREVLLAGRGQAEVRRELGRWPCWGHMQGAQPRTHAADVPGPARAPEPVWGRPLPLTGEAWCALLASPLGVAASCYPPEGDAELGVFDPDTGERRWGSSLVAEATAWIAGERLVIDQGEGAALVHELWTGDFLGAVVWPGPVVSAAGETVVCRAEQGDLVAARLDPGPEVRSRTLWRRSPYEALRSSCHDQLQVVVAGDAVLLSGVDQDEDALTLVGLDLASGTPRWERRRLEPAGRSGTPRGWIADGHGLVLALARRGIAGLAPDGAERWRGHGGCSIYALGAGWLALARKGEAGERVLLVERDTGALLGEPALAGRYLGPCALARDQLVLSTGPLGEAEDELLGVARDGAVLWRQPGVRADALALLPGRVYAADAESGALLCLREAGLRG